MATRDFDAPPRRPAHSAPFWHCAYRLGEGLYLNLTNRCTLTCAFCQRPRGDFQVAGHDLRLAWEPEASMVIARLLSGWPFGESEPGEIVFCGLGEPTLRWEPLLTVARWLRRRHPAIPLRLDTDGLANLRQDRDVTPDLGALFDAVSVSLNAHDGATYAALCPSRHGAAAHEAVLEFLRSASGNVPFVRASVVDVPGVDVEACRRLAERIGVPLLVRRGGAIGRHPLAVLQ